ncbi:hypothetical protein [Luteolibacter luteus]|uniref:Uncharacterized protein n=1 Tax=Luteolibacter luteus TaxID=2728835 RepID=A0A858RQ43_9BACT|nr:hypothetical protein [Luteolibacter luteus]QJE99002.1 hypothetical protein HHL09_25555 [Luteolibacter luteus]
MDPQPGHFDTRSDAIAYLLALPPTRVIGLPKHPQEGAERSLEIAALEAFTEQTADEFGLARKRWEWTAGDLVTELVVGCEAYLMDSDSKVEVVKVYRNGDVGVRLEDGEMNSVPVYELEF